MKTDIAFRSMSGNEVTCVVPLAVEHWMFLHKARTSFSKDSCLPENVVCQENLPIVFFLLALFLRSVCKVNYLPDLKQWIIQPKPESKLNLSNKSFQILYICLQNRRLRKGLVWWFCTWRSPTEMISLSIWNNLWYFTVYNELIINYRFQNMLQIWIMPILQMLAINREDFKVSKTAYSKAEQKHE